MNVIVLAHKNQISSCNIAFCLHTNFLGSEASETSAAVTANYENVEIQPPTVTAGEEDNMYEHVELRPITTQQKEIEVAPNAAYVTV